MTQAGLSEISFFDPARPVWDISDAMATEELRGPALYEALMALKPEGLTEYAWAEQAGLNRGFLNDIKKKADSSPRASSLNRLLAEAGKTVADLYGLAASRGRQEVREVARPFSAIELPRDVPIRGTAAGADISIEDETGRHSVERTLVEAEPIAFAKRPPSIAKNRFVYAIFVTGESMEPRYRPGDLVYVDPKRDPYVGDDVIVQLVDEARADADPSEVASVLIKRLTRRTATHYELEQFSPPETFRLERKRVSAIHRIIPLSELLS